MEDLRRKRKSSRGRVEAICTLCELEGRPYVWAEYEYVVASTPDQREERITVCADHAERLDAGKLSYRVIRRRKGVDWLHPL
jgi:hypothetical protein